MIFMGSNITAEYLFVRYDLKDCCVGASFSINQVFIFALGRMFGYRCVMFWMGTDVLQYCTVWHYRWRLKLFERFIDKHYAQSEWLKDELSVKLKKPVEVLTIKPTWMEYEHSLLRPKSQP